MEYIRPQFGRFGPRYDYTGAQVTLEYQGRTLLGDIVSIRRDDRPAGGYFATVKHFNGEDWPIEPLLAVLKILPRNDR